MTTALFNVSVITAVCALLAIVMWLPSRLPGAAADPVEFEVTAADERLAA
jgi:hypothetical protein